MYSEEDKAIILAKVVDRLIDGESLRQIARDEDMPPRITLIRWINSGDNDIDTIIARARDMQAEALHDDMADICHKMEAGELDANTGKAIIWAKQWSAGKLRPKKYGDRIHTEHSGSVSLADMTETDLARRLAELEQIKAQSAS
jgi:hypothetical protein